MLTLSNGTVVQQMVSPTELCTGKHLTYLIQTKDLSILDHHLAILKRGIAKRFGDGNGMLIIKAVLHHNHSLSPARIQCCYTNGCNENIERAVQSKN